MIEDWQAFAATLGVEPNMIPKDAAFGRNDYRFVSRLIDQAMADDRKQ